MENNGLILVVDDTLTNLEVITESLENVGYEVVTAIDGERALKRVQHQLPDLILLDVQMPGIDGFEVCQQLKQDPQTAAVPVIFMTALSDTDSKVKGFAVGGVDYITKPFQVEEFIVRLNTHLQLRRLTLQLEQQVADRTAGLQSALEQLRQSQIHLIQGEKMAALGSLVAGVAHEVNNPLGCITGNLKVAQSYINDLLKLIDGYQAELPSPSSVLQQTLEVVDLEFVRSDLPKLMASMTTSADRIRHISNSLRVFSRADNDQPVFCNLHEGIDSTLMILKHRLKANEFRPEIEVIRNYGILPEIQCFAGPLNQVFMNLLANAIDALDEISQKRTHENQSRYPNRITIQTQLITNQQQVEIRIQDNGIGMTEAVKSKIFDPLFTTKAVGKGTGLGLEIARQIIVEKHGGTIAVESTTQQGTEFILTLPTTVTLSDRRQAAGICNQ